MQFEDESVEMDLMGVNLCTAAISMFMLTPSISLKLDAMCMYEVFFFCRSNLASLQPFPSLCISCSETFLQMQSCQKVFLFILTQLIYCIPGGHQWGFFLFAIVFLFLFNCISCLIVFVFLFIPAQLIYCNPGGHQWG